MGKKNKNRDDGGSSVRIKNVNLKDKYSSTSLDRIISREILWGIVQYIVKADETEKKRARMMDELDSVSVKKFKSGHIHFSDDDSADSDNIHSNENGNSNCKDEVENIKDGEGAIRENSEDNKVESLESQVNSKEDVDAKTLLGLPFAFGTTKRKLALPVLATYDKKKGSNSLPRPTFIREENLYLAPKPDGNYYPAQINGIGPTNTSEKPTCMIRYVGYGYDLIEIDRSALLPLPVQLKKQVCESINMEEQKHHERLAPESIVQAGLLKYWDQRKRLFSKYDEGIRLDDESWYSVTPEIVAHHVSKTIRKAWTKQTAAAPAAADNASNLSTNHVASVRVLDLFCGCGGNSISLASHEFNVVSVDIDPVKGANCR